MLLNWWKLIYNLSKSAEHLKAGFRGTFMPLSEYIFKKERFKISNIDFHLREVEKKEQNKTKARGRMKLKTGK